MAVNRDLYLTQGDDFGYSILLSNTDGTLLNVNGASFTSQAKLSYFTSNISANLTVTVLDAANGNLSISLDSANTSNLAAGIYVYDVRMKTLGNTSSHILSGQLVVQPGVTGINPNGLPAL